MSKDIAALYIYIPFIDNLVQIVGPVMIITRFQFEIIPFGLHSGYDAVVNVIQIGGKDGAVLDLTFELEASDLILVNAT